MLLNLVIDATSINHQILAQGQINVTRNHCTSIANIPTTLYSVILLSMQTKKSKLSPLVLCIIKLNLVLEPAYYLNEQAFLFMPICYPENQRQGAHMNLGQIIFQTDCWYGSTPRDARHVLGVDFITGCR